MAVAAEHPPLNPRDPVALGTAIRWAERGRLPDGLVRAGVRRLLRQRLAQTHYGDAQARAAATQDCVQQLRLAEIAPAPERANAEHYELPAAFFQAVLGPHLKYSSACWPDPTSGTLADAEAHALVTTCERAALRDGQTVLELGCGWGSLTLWMAEHYPSSRIVALSNSHAQRRHIHAQLLRRGLRNVEVITEDINGFRPDRRFDRVVSVEMFEHLRNWPRAFARVATWLAPGGRFFLHVFAHDGLPYVFAEEDESDWMGRHFFSHGLMPSDDLALLCQDDLRLLQRWRWDGRHYARTARAWLRNMDARRTELRPVLAEVYGRQADLWWNRWRLFFLSVEELFGYEGGQVWWVSHYLFERRA